MHSFSSIRKWIWNHHLSRSVGFLLLVTVFLASIIFIGANASKAFAAPPLSPYAPGETLDPACAPGDLNCTVTPPLTATTTLTTGSLLFIGNASGTVYQNNGNLFWDNVNDRLGIGTATPSSTLSIIGGASISGNVTTTNLTITGITGGSQCLHVNANGVVSGTGLDCGSGGGASSTSINGISAGSFTFAAAGTGLSVATSAGPVITFTISSSSYLQPFHNLSDLASTSTARSNLGLGSAATYAFTDFLSSSTPYVATTSGNWAGTWQGVNSSSFYLASNPNGYIATSTGLTVANFASQNISQWTNNAGYLTSLSGALLAANNLSDLASTSTARSNLGLGSAATYAFTDFLSSSTPYVATTSGNWAGTWQGVNSSSFYLASNPNGYIATSTGLTVANFASQNISQWTNNAGYLTSLSGALLAANNLSDLASTSTARSNLGLGSAATYAFTDFLSSSTPYVATTSGNWAGTWQGVNSSSFYLASNPNGYIATSTGLTVANFASQNISQWTNNAGYLTSLSGALLAANNLSDLASTSTARSNLGLGSAATYAFTDFLSSSTPYVATTSGNWAGTWQGVNSSSFYLASNPNGYIATSTGLTVANFASQNISQWTNNAGYLTSLSGALLAANNLSDLASTSTARSNLGLGSAATYAFTDFLSSSTPYVATTSGNWAGTWQGVNSSSFYLASNPNGYIATSTFNATGVSYYFPFWNGSGNSLVATSSIFQSSSTGYIGINNINPGRQLDVAGYSTTTSLTNLSTAEIGITNTASSTNGNYSGIAFITYNSNGTQSLVGKIAGVAVSHTAGAVSGNLSFITANGGTSQDDLDILSNGQANFLGSINSSGTISELGVPVIATNTGNWAGTWQGVSSSSFLSTSTLSNVINGSVYASGSQLFAATGTPFYFPIWGPQGIILQSSSSIYQLTGGNIGIGTNAPLSTFEVAGNGIFTKGIAVGTTTTSTALTYIVGTSTQDAFDVANASGTTALQVIGSSSPNNIFEVDNNSSTAVFSISSSSITNINGNVAIGTSLVPYSELTVSGLPSLTSTSTLLLLGSNFITGGNGSGTFLGANPALPFNGDFVNFETSSTSEFRVTATGTVIAAGGFMGQCLTSGGFNGTSSNSCNMDVAESYPTFELTAAGDVVAVPPSSTQEIDATSTIVELGKSRGAAGERVIGVVSTNPGLVFKNGSTFLAGANDKYVSSTETVVALTGRVPVSVSLENGPITAGDELAASADLPGVAVRATSPGYVIGFALQSYNATTPSSSLVFQPSSTIPQIMIFVEPHWSLGNLTTEGSIASSSWTTASSTSSGVAEGALDQFTLYIKYALQKLGIVIANGVATVQQLFAQKITTNELCVGTTCVNQQQLAQIIANENNNSGGASASSGSDDGENSSSSSSNTTPLPANISVGSALGITLTSLTPSSTVSSSVELDVDITLAASTTVSRVDYQVDGTELGQGLWTNNPEYSYNWNTEAGSDGNHVVTAMVTDTTGATSTTSIRVMVSNNSSSADTNATSSEVGNTITTSSSSTSTDVTTSTLTISNSSSTATSTTP